MDGGSSLPMYFLILRFHVFGLGGIRRWGFGVGVLEGSNSVMYWGQGGDSSSSFSGRW